MVTEEDLLRGVTVAPGWLTCLVKELNQEPSAAGDSLNTIVDLVIVEDGEYKGVPLRRYFNEKAPGLAVTFFEACGAKVNKPAPGQSIQLPPWEPCKGKTIEVMVTNGEYRGRKTNVVEDFRPHT